MLIKNVALLLLLAGNGATALRHGKKYNKDQDSVLVPEDMEVLLRLRELQMSMPALPTPSPTTPAPTTPAPTFVCNLTPQERATEFRKMALQTTTAATLNNKNSPQAKALDWIANKDQMNPTLCPSDESEARQRYIMATFYFATGGGSWTECNAPVNLSSAAIAVANQKCSKRATTFGIGNRKIGTDAWLTPLSVCDWGGLACYGDDTARKGTLDQIDFEDNNLSGSLIDEIGSLENLRFLILEQGKIEGEIPESIGNLKLLVVDLDFNELSGKIPQSLYSVNTLQQLDLNDNKLTGQLPSDVDNWKRMTFLQVSNNNFIGNIPTELGELKQLSECTTYDGILAA